MYKNLEKLFMGDLNMSESIMSTDKEYENSNWQFEHLRKKLENTMDDEQCLILEKLLDENLKMNYIYSKDCFVSGFKLAMHIVFESLN